MGCQMNQSDGERLAFKLESMGYALSPNEEEANLIAVVACSVRQRAIDRIYGRAKIWNEWKKNRPLLLLLTGCVLAHDRPNMRKIFDCFFDINDLQTLEKKILAKENALENINPRSDYFAIPPKRKNQFQTYVPIMTGCNEFCSYCAVPFTRGREMSRPAEEIMKEVQSLINDGVKEITFLGQTIDSYQNPDPNHPIQSLSHLLRSCANLSGEFWIRFLTSHPNYFSEDLIDAIASEKKILPVIHLPIQSGDNEILRRMNRKYTREHYLDIVENIRSKIPHAYLSTDIIVGFCGETEKQFSSTVEIMERVKFDMAYIAQYSPRPGTASQKIWKDDVPKKEKTRRENILNELLKSHRREKSKRLIGTRHTVLLEFRSSQFGRGRTSGYEHVEMPLPQSISVGQFVRVTLTKAKDFSFQANVIR